MRWLIGLVLLAGAAIWTYRDAQSMRQRGATVTPEFWAISVLLALVVALPLYFIFRFAVWQSQLQPDAGELQTLESSDLNDALSRWLRSLNPGVYVLAVVVASYVVVLPFALLQVPRLDMGPGPDEFLRKLGFSRRLLVASFVAPTLETALFQWIPIRLLRTKLRLPWVPVLTTSAALFAANHLYSLGYVIFAFLLGLVLAYCFAVRDRPGREPFLLTCLVHGLRNGIAVILV
jgi:hypothetical protein